ncbi:tetratricopeptide repeat protein [Bremerella cremea]|uniref:tetratricopeptide repeat protein n=1 Tax=Bremerella cremea TaxID=1031537 RepID=UPI00131447A7|nr:tetratricopeptide repeat protein [Bremerella cremea]
MRYVSILSILAFLAAGSFAQAQGLGQYHYKSRSNITVGRGGYADVTRPGGYSGNYSHGNANYHHHNHHHGGGFGYRYPSYGGFWGGSGMSIGIGLTPYGYPYSTPYVFNYGGGYPFNYSSLYPYGTYYRPGDQYLEYYLPPTQPAELNYGPQAMKQFMGLPRDFAIQPQRQQAFSGLASPLVIPEMVAKPVMPIEQPSPQAVERAARFIQAGDALFRQQRYSEALGRYKDAVAAAPGDAQGHLHKALAYLALNRSEEAVKALKLAVQQDPDVAESNLTLNGLLDSNAAAKASIIEANARRAVADPQNADLLFCVGVLLHFDGEDAQATKFFEAAQRNAGGGDLSYIDAFLKDNRPPANTGSGIEL